MEGEERGVLKMKLARGTAAATLDPLLWVGWRVARTKWRFRVADVRDGPNKVLISASPFSPYVRVLVRVRGSIQFQRKPKEVVPYTSRDRPRRVPTLPTPPARNVRRSIRRLVLSGRPQIPRGAPNDLSPTYH